LGNNTQKILAKPLPNSMQRSKTHTMAIQHPEKQLNASHVLSEKNPPQKYLHFSQLLPLTKNMHLNNAGW
jgi:hypothetical protein